MKSLINLIGAVFVLFGLLGFFNSFYYGSPQQVFWFCYIGLILIGVGTLLRSSYLIASQLCILFVPFIFWIIDFVSYFFLTETLFGLTSYFFVKGHLLGKIVALQHLFTLPLCFYVLYKIKIKRFDFWKLSFLQVFLVFFVTRVFSDFERNINCVYRNCLPFSLPAYPVWWFLVFGMMISLTAFIFSRVKLFRR